MNKKITPENEEFIATENAKGQSTYRIAKALSLDQKTIWNWLNNPSHLDIINKHTSKWRADPMTIDLAHKKTRLYDLDEARKHILNTMRRYVNADGEIYEKKLNKYLSLAKRLIEIEQNAREEIEKKPEFMAMWEKNSPYSELPNDELQRTKDLLERRIVERGCIISATDPRQRHQAGSITQPGAGK